MKGKFLRGEIYWWKLGNDFGSEESVLRPGVIVSSDGGNEKSPVVNVVCLTTKPRENGEINVEIHGTYEKSWALCNQIKTFDKSRVGRFMCMVSDEEMREIDRALMVALGLSYEDDEIEDDDGEIDYEDQITELKYQNNVLQKLYEKALEELVSMRLGVDLAKKEEVAPKKKAAGVKLIEVKPPEEEPTTYEINSCSEDDLRRCGCNPDMIRKIIERRPYAKIDDLRFVPGLTGCGYAILKAKLTCVPVVQKKVEEPKPKKLNVNSMTAEDWMGLGVGECSANYIVSYVKNHGPIKKVEELQDCPRFGNGFIKKYGSMLEV